MAKKTINPDDLSVYEELLKEDEKYGEPRRYPWILYGCWKNDIYDGTPHPKPSLCRIRVTGGHGGAEKMQYRHRKGYRILKYWIPTQADLPRQRPETESGWKLELRNNPYHFFELENRIKQYMGEAKMIDRLQRENADLQSKFEAMKGKVQDEEKKSTKYDKKATGYDKR